MNLDNENVLIAGLIKGNESAYKHLYKLYYTQLFTYLTSITGSKEMSKDLSQQVFIKLWRKRESLSIHSSLKKYIFKIGYHLFLDLQEKKKKDFKLLERLKHEALHEIAEIPDDNFEQKISFILDEVNKLPQQCRTVFLLAKKDGLKYREISAELNISIKTVERHMSKALRRLRKSLQNNKNSLFVITFCDTQQHRSKNK